MKKTIRIVATVLALLMLCNMTVFAESTNYNVNVPYYSYTYNSSDEPIQIPAPYAASRVIKGKDLGVSEFVTLADVYYDRETGWIFLTDSGANTITILDQDYSLIRVMHVFDNHGTQDTFQTPSSVCVRDGNLYVADTGNARILRFDVQTFALQQVLEKPEIKILGENYTYKPDRIAIDLAGRIYCIATDINDGILLLDTDGTFIRFVAAPDVETNLWTKFLKMFMTKAQKEDLEKAVPTEYSSLYMDELGFLYLTSSDTEVNPITKINSQGTDILKYESNNNPDGDASHMLRTTKPIASTFVDIAVRQDDIYAALDTKMGRIFVYDQEGSLLYAFGGIGSQDGMFYAPSAIEMFGDTILVTDNFYGTLTVFKRTEFGMVVDNATNKMLAGEYDEAKVEWNNVLRLCPTYDAANLSLARVDIQNHEYSAALKKLEGTTWLGYYSKAYEGVREAFLAEHFNWIIVLIALLGVLMIARRIFRDKLQTWKKKFESNKLVREVRYSNYTMFHPFDGFWDLKHEKRGSLAAANVLTLMFIVTYALRTQFSGYIFTGKLPGEVNTIYEIIVMVLPLGLWVVANWCFTSLMDGEGTMKDIYIATAYALRPYIITAIPLCLLTHCLSEDEAFIYTTLSSVVMIWMLGLIFLAMITTHDYSLSKGVLVAILTLLGICLILFIALTFSNIIQQIYDFAMDLYREFVYRTY
ncbi:MAG: YIP1 family protein [Tyzzerella sp.]|nr:YIP1 family protein [Tyzzerella sp.]